MQPSLLEKIRTANKARKEFRNQMPEDSFIVPKEEVLNDFQFGTGNSGQGGLEQFFGSPAITVKARSERKLTYNHYADLSKKLKDQPQLQFLRPLGAAEAEPRAMPRQRTRVMKS